MDNIWNEALKRALPDLYNELFPKGHLYNPFEEFTLFQSLPKELRLKIWRCTFEPRVINLDDFTKFISKGEGTLVIRPITLCVNGESRQETLRHFTIFPSMVLGSLFKFKPTFLNYNMDTIQLAWGTELKVNGDILTMQTIAKEAGPDVFKKIKHIEIRLDAGFRWKKMAQRLRWMKRLFLVQTFFSELETVVVTRPQYWKRTPKLDSELELELEKSVKEILEKAKRHFVNGKTPEVVVRKWMVIKNE